MDTFDLSHALACLEGGAPDDDSSAQGAVADSRLIEALPAHVYHGDRDALSCSMLKPLLISPAHFQAALVADTKSTDAKDFGTLLHLLVLEPEQVAREVAVFPGVANKRTNAFGEFEAANRGKMVIDEPAFSRARSLADKVLATPYKGRALRHFIDESKREVTIYYTDPTTGLRHRVRIDAYHPELNFDLKSTRFADPRAFTKDAVDKAYDMQAFMYGYARSLFEGRGSLRPFVFITAENAEPFSVSTLTAGAMFVDNGAKKYQACVAAYLACSKTGHWPDLGRDCEIELEPWQQFQPEAGWRAGLGTLSS